MNIMGAASFGGKPYIVPLVTEWQVLYYRKDLLEQGRPQGADDVR